MRFYKNQQDFACRPYVHFHCFRPPFPALEAGLYIVWKKYLVLSKASNAFLNKLKKELKGLDSI